MAHGWLARLASSLLAFSASLSAYSAPAEQLTHFEIPRAASQWKKAWLKAQREVWGLRHPAWLAAQVGQESGWRDGLTSRVGARGLCQAMPATARGMERLYPDLQSLGRYSPQWCFRFQALLMRDLFRTYKDVRDDCNAIKFAGSAYNGGPGMLNREIGLCHKDKDQGCRYEEWAHVSKRNARAMWAFEENRDYVYRISLRSKFYAAAGWGAYYCAPAEPVPEPSGAPLPERTPAP